MTTSKKFSFVQNHRSVVSRAILAIIASLVIGVSSAVADPAAEHYYEWTKGQTENAPRPFGILDNAGEFENLTLKYDTTLEELSVDFTISKQPDPRELAKLFTIVVTPGYLPASSGNEAAIFYFDASGLTPVLTAYTMVPDPGDLDWETGSWHTGDALCTSLKATSCGGWVKSLSSTDNSDGTRTFQFTVSTAAINAHVPTTANPDGLPWTGAQFVEEVGIWIETFSYPNLSSQYKTDGFLSSLKHGCHVYSSADCDYGSIDFQGYFDEEHLQTHQKPYCDDPSGVVDLLPGQPFNSVITAVSPDGDPLTVTYTGVPQGASVTPPSGTEATDDGQSGAGTVVFAELNWTPTEDDNPSSHKVTFTFTEKDGTAVCDLDIRVFDDVPPPCDGVVDQCGVCNGDGTSCLGCTEVNILSTQFSMDGNAFLQFQNIRKLNRRLVRLTRGTENATLAKKIRHRTNTNAEDLYLSSWVATWSFDSALQQCTNETLCVSVSSAPVLSTYVEAVDALYDTAARLSRKIKKLAGKKSGKLLDAAATAQQDALSSAALIPSSQSLCGN